MLFLWGFSLFVNSYFWFSNFWQTLWKKYWSHRQIDNFIEMPMAKNILLTMKGNLPCNQIWLLAVCFKLVFSISPIKGHLKNGTNSLKKYSDKLYGTLKFKLSQKLSPNLNQPISLLKIQLSVNLRWIFLHRIGSWLVWGFKRHFFSLKNRMSDLKPFQQKVVSKLSSFCFFLAEVAVAQSVKHPVLRSLKRGATKLTWVWFPVAA